MSKRQEKRAYKRLIESEGLSTLKKLEAQKDHENRNLNLYQKVLRFIRGERYHKQQDIDLLKRQLKSLGLLPYTKEEQRKLEKLKVKFAENLLKGSAEKRSWSVRFNSVRKRLKTLLSKRP